MDLIDELMNGIVAIIALFTIFFFFLPYRLFMSLVSTAKATPIFKENVIGKVILITGASSGIGEHVAYEYGRRGARLALVARREHRLREVSGVCEMIGSPECVYIVGDVANIDDCKRFVDATVSHFGRLDHLVTNAGVTPVCMFEDYDDITKASPAMDINFWGSVHGTYYAYPHLRKSKGKIIVIASSTGWLFAPRLSFYSASKAAVISFYETLRIEFGDQIGITIVTPGLIKTEMTDGKFLSKQPNLKLDPEMRDVEISLMPLESADKCGKAIVEGACRGDKYLTVPYWYNSTKLWKLFCPEIMDTWLGFLLMPRPASSPPITKKLTDFANGLKELL